MQSRENLRWSEEELRQLRLIFPHHHTSKVAVLMGGSRSVSAIARKACKMGLHKSVVFRDDLPYNLEGGLTIQWTPSMLKFLREEYAITKNEDMCTILGISQRALTRKARELGLVKNRQWLSALSRTNVLHASFVSNVLHAGQFRKGHPATPSCFKPGHVPDTIQPVVRLDTLEVAPSCWRMAEILGCCSSNVQNACHRKGNARGVPVRFCKDMKCGSCRFLVGLSHEETHGDAICGCGLDSHITTTETTGCKKFQPVILKLNEK